MGHGKSPSVEDPGDHEQVTDQQLAAIRGVSIAGRAVHGKLPPVSFYSYRTGELQRLVSEYEQLYFKRGPRSKETKTILNKLAERIGEVSADIEVRKKYGSAIKERIKIPLRGSNPVPKGAPMLDLVYELTTGEILIVEAKYNDSLRGRVNEYIFAADDAAGIGAVEEIALKGEVDQLSGKWIKDNVYEIGERNRPLGNRLNKAIKNDKIIVIEHRVQQRVVVDGNTRRIVIEPVVKDETDAVKKYFREGRQQLTDEARVIDRKLAKHEGFLRLDFEKAERKVARLKEEADKAGKNLTRKQRQYETAERELKNLGPKARPKTRSDAALKVEKRRQELVDAQKAFETAEKAFLEAARDAETLSKSYEAARASQKARFTEQRLARLTEHRLASTADAAATIAKAALKKAERKVARLKEEAEKAGKNLTRKQRQYETAERNLKNLGPKAWPKTRSDAALEVEKRRQQLADAQKALEAAEKASLEAARDAETLSKSYEAARASQEVRLTEQRMARLTGQRLAGTARVTETVAGGAGRIVKVVEEVKPFTKFVFKSLSRIKLVGRAVLIGLNVMNPIFDVLLVVDLVDSLFNWLKSDEIEEGKEWGRIIHFLRGEPETIKTIYGTVYSTSQRDGVDWRIEQRLGDTSKNAKNILFWQAKWSQDKNWNGFVYAFVEIDLERQEGWGRDAETDPYRIKYIFKGGTFNLELTEDPPRKYKRGSDTHQTAYTDDPRNWTTGGALDTPRFTAPRYEYNVNISTLFVRLPLSKPVLTPFDFILTKCSALLFDLSTFLSKYDPHIFSGMALRWESGQSLRPDWLHTIKIDWVDVHDFPYPLRSEDICFCIKLVYWAIEQLSLHPPKTGDLTRDNELSKFNAGFTRRANILFELNRSRYSGKRPFYELGFRLNNIIADLGEHYLLKPVNAELKYLTPKYLADLAFEIDGDLKRAYANISDTRNPARRQEFNYAGRI